MSVVLTGDDRWDTYLFLLSGDCGALQQEASNDDYPNVGVSGLDEAVLDPGVYYVVVSGYVPASAGAFTLDVTLPEVPVPDTCAEPVEIPAEGEQVYEGDTSLATPTWPAEAPRANDTWHHFRLERPTTVEALLEGEANWDTYLYLLDGTCDAPTQVLYNDDFPNIGRSGFAPRDLEPGDYWIVVSGYRADRAGAYTLSLLFEPVPIPGETCATAYDLSTAGPQQLVDDTSAYYPDWPAERPRARDVFYRFELNEETSFGALLQGAANWDTYLYLLGGECDALEVVDFNDDFPNVGVSGLEEQVLQPGTYYLVVSGFVANSAGTYVLDVSFPATGLPEDCASAAPIPALGTQQVSGDTTGAAADWPVGAERAPDTWHRFLLLEPTTVSGLLQGADNWDTYLFLLRGSCDGGLQQELRNDDFPNVGVSGFDPVELEAGEYWLVVSGFTQAHSGAYDLTLTFE